MQNKTIKTGDWVEFEELVLLNPDFTEEYQFKKTPLIHGIHKWIAGLLIKSNIIWIAFRIYLNPIKVIFVLRRLESLRRQYMGDFKIQKLFKIYGRYYWDMHAPGWPSKAFVTYNEGEMNRILPFRPIHDYLNSMILAITKKCPLHCQHCFEWDAINQDEKLSQEDLKLIIQKFQNRGKGVAQIQLSGGEPLSRYGEIIEILKSAKQGTDFWIVTSGYNFTLEKARSLKTAGLIGMALSLDHYKKEEHNAFRGSQKSYDWAIRAIQNAHKANLVVTLSLCVTKEFTSKNNLFEYANYAKKLGAAFILLLEPRAVGRYAGKEVYLSKDQISTLDDFYIKMNYDPNYADFPAVSYHGYHQRRIGCFGGTNRFVYLNTDGDLQVCPYCQKKYGNATSDSITELAKDMNSNGCLPYMQATV